ncbi:MAG TPA: hypothetical protein VM427_10130 [Patescibacteria group bacterium]|nr:hypothetical protein [Patescibacteria group bacterium]
MSTFDVHLRHRAGEESREKTIPDPGPDRGLFMLAGPCLPAFAPGLA